MIRRTLSLVVMSVMTLLPASGAEFLFGEPKAMGELVNSPGSDFAHVSASGTSIYVMRGLTPVSGGPIYVAERSDEGQPWGPLEKLGENINSSTNGIPSLAADELTLYFSDTSGIYGSVGRSGLGGGDLWYSTRPSVDSEWGPAMNVGEVVNSRFIDADPSITADGLSLFLASNRPGGSGGMDIWTSSRPSTTSPWTTPVNLGPNVNSSGDEMVLSISSDGLTLFFENGGNRPDLWVASRADLESAWSAPVNLGPKINTSNAETGPQLSADGSTLYYSHWNATGNAAPEFDVFAVELLPFERVSLSVGSAGYTQDFDDALGANGAVTGRTLPKGWTTSDNGTIFSNETDLAFPIDRRLGSGGNPILNAGAEGNTDRALAIGAKDRVEGGMIQLLADVSAGDASSVQLLFDVEAWDASTSSRTDDPGEAAFRVHLDIDRGDGYQTLADLGTVGVGGLAIPTEAYLDGNAPQNRTSIDTGQIFEAIPEGSKLRVRWHVDNDAQTNNWVFGLDNIRLSLFDMLNAAFIDELSAAVRTDKYESYLDLDGDGFVNDVDRTIWIEDMAGSFLGDADLNKKVDFADFLALSSAYGAEGGWAQGDFDGNGLVEFPDFLALSANYGAVAPPSAAAVPEPGSTCLALLGVLGSIGFGRRRGKATVKP